MTTVTHERPSASTPTPGPRRVALAILALATGGFAIGTTEFVTMGVLPEIAAGVGVSIPSAGHLVSAYALGVVVGAPVLAYVGARLPRRSLAVALMVAFVVGNVGSALAASYGLLMLSRFVAGLPHGAFFGVASLIAAGLVADSRKGRAVAMVMLGLSVANVFGVPAGTWLGQNVGWREVYWLVAVLGLVTVVLTVACVPHTPGDPHASGRRELTAFARPQVWLTLVAGAGGFGGMFAVYTYIAETVRTVGGLGSGAVPLFLLAYGLGMVAGTWVAGELADWSVLRSLFIGSAGMGVSLLAFFVLAPGGWWGVPAVFAIAVMASVLAVNLQLRLMSVAGEAKTLGAAMNHASLNIANAAGAWFGGLVITAGLGYRAPALVGVALSVFGLVVLTASAALERHQTTERARIDE
ncbi:MFS transporter [Nocardioides lentus]|uniref:MFS transporter n=1 Tax=Nocardioides lentus TaxID=338077 RepID=A0ABN2PNU2_9ACTN